MAGFVGPLGRGETVGQALTGATDAVSGFFKGLDQSALSASKSFGEGVKATFGDPNEPFTPASVVSDAIRETGKAITDPMGQPGRAVESGISIGGDLAAGAVDLAKETADTVYKGLPQEAKDFIGTVESVLPDVGETAALGLSSKLLNSAMGVAGGTAGQAVGKVAAPVVGAADIAGSAARAVGSVNLPNPSKIREKLNKPVKL